MKPVATIYIISRKGTEWVYVGVTKHSLKDRLRAHYKFSLVCHYRKPSLFLRDLKTYGIDSFEISALEEVFDIDLIEERENYWIEKYRGANCYNKNRSVYGTSVGAKMLRSRVEVAA